ncbi:uncharacterized protein LOC116306173 [Actinia tenebrosa]|uniref:Uncharacterized protein LOC116306173 n=1 Tax=Actinia tenebrosa TaxID=6105 RepID=A0A6P8J3A1_ACTTE|nr:uncharacterized protein LOC116306173 [Actinia tenebrosa]
MASKDTSKVAKGLGKDPSLCRLGQRMISTMLKEERIAERDLQEKLKAISAKEHKSMVKLGCDSLEVRHDLTRQRSSSPVPGGDVLDILSNKGKESPVDSDNNPTRPGLQGRRAISMLDYSYKQEQVSVVTGEYGRVYRVKSEKTRSSVLKSSSQTNPTINVENHVEHSLEESKGKTLDDKTSFTENGMKSALNNTSLQLINSSCDGNTSPATSPRFLRRRPVSDISSSSFSEVCGSSEVDEVIVEKIVLEKGFLATIPQKPTTPPLRGTQGPSTTPTRVPWSPSTPPPARRAQTTLSADFSQKQRPSSARMVRSKSPASVGATLETMRGRDRIRLDLPQGSAPTRSRSPSPSPSPSPSRLSPEPLSYNLGRRGSGPPRINVNSLPPSSPLRKGLGMSDVTQSLAPISPDALRRQLSANEEDLQDRVQGFLKTLGKK